MAPLPLVDREEMPREELAAVRRGAADFFLLAGREDEVAALDALDVLEVFDAFGALDDLAVFDAFGALDAVDAFEAFEVFFTFEDFDALVAFEAFRAFDVFAADFLADRTDDLLRDFFLAAMTWGSCE